MKKSFASNLQISLRILKETYDDQYDDCLSQLRANEIQIKLGTTIEFFDLRIKTFRYFQGTNFQKERKASI